MTLRVALFLTCLHMWLSSRTDYACISYVDHMIGWLVGEVKKQQLCSLELL